ncbi:Gfo/Idh/MocA family oxidoreductase [Seonamhaeicola sp.]|uniref:Gfo/Idh/MocA family protein n=1 Tax=Seonamhaeicola sp. TaxID=1912245 RepID=UPI00262D94DB|nr:Gfo/Idh/MocA family oxidoreductase [Seonamhaeicola sp.]
MEKQSQSEETYQEATPKVTVGNTKRRNLIKGLIGLPFLGLFFQHFGQVQDSGNSDNYLEALKKLGLDFDEVEKEKQLKPIGDAKTLRIGVVGLGWRGPDLMRSLGYIDDELIAEDPYTLEEMKVQEDLNVEIVGVCDLYSLRAERGAKIGSKKLIGGKIVKVTPPIIYPTYRDMLNNDRIDAIMIATADLWHAEIAIEASKRGVHVYCEKPMTRTIEEAVALRKAIQQSKVVFQLGHQNRQQASYIKAKQLLDQGVIGTVSAIETYTDRNSDFGAWIRGIDPKANASNVNWKEYIRNTGKVPFDLDKFFNWQKYFDFGTGPGGNQFTHAFDGVNQVLGVGIPKSAVALGGNYYFKDPRDIPDSYNVIYNYPDKGLTLTYDCTLKSRFDRGIHLLGTKAQMEIGAEVHVFPDLYNEAYMNLQRKEGAPIYTFPFEVEKVDGISGATANYYKSRGLGTTLDGGVIVDSTYLHVKEWIDAIRYGTKVSCDIQAGFEESVTFIMGNLAYQNGKRVDWDETEEKVIMI